MNKKRNNPIVFFYILLSYTLLQFIWWMVNLNQLNIEVYGESSSKKWMIIGEGTVFLIILLLGFSYTIKAFKKELELSKQQSNFLLAITHELKTPLSSIKLFFQTLKRPELEKEKKNDLIEKGLHDVDRLNQMIENLLLSARVEGSALKIQKEKIKLHEHLIKLSDQAQLTFGKNHIIKLVIKSNPIIHTDSQALTSIITNLLENACKYSPADSKIIIRLEEEQDIVALSIEDEGIGVKANDQKKIFDKFIRIQNEDTRSTKGTGLGLYIVKQLTKLINGSIEHQPNSPKGSIFVLKLPKNNI